MLRVGLVSCGKQKRDRPSPAGRLYTSTLFKKAVEYLHTQGITEWWVLSAKHGLVRPKTVIAPYDKTLKTMSREARQKWSGKVRGQLFDAYGDRVLKSHKGDDRVKLVCLASGRYKEPLTDELRVVFPWDGMTLYDRVSFHRWQGFKLPRVYRAAVAMGYDADAVQRIFDAARVPFDRKKYQALRRERELLDELDVDAIEDAALCAALTLARRAAGKSGLFD